MKQRIINITSAIWKVYFALVFIVTLILLYPIFYYLLANEKRYPYCFKLQKAWSYFMLLVAGVVIKTSKQEKLPPPYVICTNHSSYFDIVLMYGIFSDYFIFMSKRELVNWPLFSIFFKKMHITINRNSKVDAHKAFIRASEELDKKHSIVFFPEGTIPDDAPKMSRFKNGAFKLAIEKQVPIIPVTFKDNWKRWQGTILFKGKAGPGLTRIVIHPAIITQGMTADDVSLLRDKVFDVIENALKD